MAQDRNGSSLLFTRRGESARSTSVSLSKETDRAAIKSAEFSEEGLPAIVIQAEADRPSEEARDRHQQGTDKHGYAEASPLQGSLPAFEEKGASGGKDTPKGGGGSYPLMGGIN